MYRNFLYYQLFSNTYIIKEFLYMINSPLKPYNYNPKHY